MQKTFFLLLALSVTIQTAAAQELEVTSATFDNNGVQQSVNFGAPSPSNNGWVQSPESAGSDEQDFNFRPMGSCAPSGSTYGPGSLDSYGQNPYPIDFVPQQAAAQPPRPDLLPEGVPFGGVAAGAMPRPDLLLEGVPFGGAPAVGMPVREIPPEGIGRGLPPAGAEAVPRPRPPEDAGVARGMPAGDADARVNTAGSGDQGFMWDNAPTSDITMTEGNDNSAFFIAPPSGTQTQTTRQSNYQGLTQQNAGNRLLAPQSTMQFGDSRSFNSAYSLGFPNPKGVAFSKNAMGYNNPFAFGPGIPVVPVGLPDTGTGSVNMDVTQGGGY